MDSEKARFLSDLGIKGIQVSIEGAEKIHDAIRVMGALPRSMSGIRHLLDQGAYDHP